MVHCAMLAQLYTWLVDHSSSLATQITLWEGSHHGEQFDHSSSLPPGKPYGKAVIGNNLTYYTDAVM